MHTSYWHPSSSQTQPEIQALENIFLSQYEQIALQQQFQLNALKEILDEFERAGIQALPLKGIDLLLRCPNARGLRSMNDIDLLIQKKDLASAVKILQGKGLTRRPHGNRFLTGSFTNESFDYLSKDRRVIFDISWNIGELDGKDMIRVWSRDVLRRTLIGERKLLHPADVFLCLIINTVVSHGVFSSSFVQDTDWLLQAEGDKMDWTGWGREIKDSGLQHVVYHGLSFLRARGLEAIPEEVFGLLRPRTLGEKTLAWFFSRMVRERPRKDPSYLLLFFGAPHWKGKLRLLQRAFFPSRDFIELRCGNKSWGERLLVGLVRPFRILFRSLAILPRDFFQLLRGRL